MCVTNTAINSHVKADMPSNADLASPKSAMPIKIDGRNVVPGLWPTDSEGQQYLAQVETEEDRNYRSPNALFPIKLHYMLEDVEQNGWEDIVSWAPHGRCFKIHNPRAFVARIMPKYFRQSKLTSFQRQLNLYDFHRLTHGPDSGSYYHEYFLRGMPRLSAQHMVRTKVKGTGVQAAAACNRLFHFEPNFYALSPIPPFDTSDTIAPISPAVSVSVTQDSEYDESIAPISPAGSVSVAQDSECGESLGETTIASDTIWNEIDPILLLGRTTHNASLDESKARSQPSSHDSTKASNSNGVSLDTNSESHAVGELEPLELALEQDEVLDYMVQQFLDSLK